MKKGSLFFAGISILEALVVLLYLAETTLNNKNEKMNGRFAIRNFLLICLFAANIIGQAQWIDELRLFPIPQTPYEMNRFNTRVYFPEPGVTFYSYQQSGIHWATYTIGRTINDYDSIQSLFSEGENYYSTYLMDLYFLDQYTGYAAVSYDMFIQINKTTNGGSNWTKVENNTPTLRVEKICYPNENLGYYVSYYGFSSGHFNLILSNNGDCTTKSVDLKYKNANLIHFINDSTGFIVCHDTLNNNVLLRTQDSASSWTEVIHNGSDTLKAIHFPTHANGFVISRNGTLYITNDAGLSWIKKEELTNEPTNDIHFVNSQLGYISCNNGQLLKTTNAGESWSAENTGIGLNLLQVFFEESGRGFILTPNDFLHTNFHTGLSANEEIQFSISPNPAKEKLYISLSKPYDLLFIEIYDIEGRCVTGKFAIANNMIDISQLKNGLYFLTVETDNKKFTKKFVKMASDLD